MRLITPPGVFRPRSDSWLLARILETHVGPETSVLDLCTGSGVLAVAAARMGARAVVGVDLSRRAAATAWLNARLNGVRITSRVGSLFDPLQGRRFDLIVSNPPYVPTPGAPPARFRASRAWHGGQNGRALLDLICDGAMAHLNPGGEILLVHSSVSDIDETVRRLRERGLSSGVVVRRRGPLGPLLSSRIPWLRARGLIDVEASEEELAVVRGRRVAA
ncbi:MAG: methyltransferase [Actinobacteria bacterium]|nr:MAG: methyltransferase [Actinomycetota bacterium]